MTAEAAIWPGRRPRETPEWFEEELHAAPIMAVFRGAEPRKAVHLAESAWNIGVRQVEVPIESPDALPTLLAVIAAGRERGMRVGAGTIIGEEQLRACFDAGAAYAVSPGLDPIVIAAADRLTMPFLPGVATATEVLRALELGFRWVKAFPASVLGPEWFTAMRGPFPAVRFVGTGGITAWNAGTFLAAGATVVGVGSALGDDAQRDELARVVAAGRVSAPSDLGTATAPASWGAET